ncbi:MAG: hypothetical protein Q9P44_11955, partial [Anaerolineae bacterium]|nr:hypothetical protein [Anaerolineae bacterium]
PLYLPEQLQIAKELGCEIIPVLIHPDKSLVKQFGALQYVDMAHGLTVDNVTLLLNSILRAERRLNSAKKHPKSRRLNHHRRLYNQEISSAKQSML